MKEDSNIIENCYTEASLVKISYSFSFDSLCTVKVLDLGITEKEADKALKYIENQVVDLPLWPLAKKVKKSIFTLETSSKNPSINLLCIGGRYVTYSTKDSIFAIDIKIPENIHLEPLCLTNNGYLTALAPRKLFLEAIAAILSKGMPLELGIGKNDKHLVFSSFEELMIDADLKS